MQKVIDYKIDGVPVGDITRKYICCSRYVEAKESLIDIPTAGHYTRLIPKPVTIREARI